MTSRFRARPAAARWPRACAAATAAVVAVAVASVSTQQPAAPVQAPGAPGQPVPGAQTPTAPAARPQAVTPAPSATAARAFTAPVGLLFNTVRPDKVADFEKLIAAVRARLESSTDPTIQAQAKGWRFYKAAEAGPGNSVLYVFVVDPTVPGEDYGLGRILSQGSTDTAALQETWKLYTGSVTGGGSLLNLSLVPDAPPEPAAGEKPAETTEKPAGAVGPASGTAKPGQKPAPPTTQK